MGLIFSMLKNDNQTLGNTTNMGKEEPDEPGVARSEGTTEEEPMGDEGLVTPVPLNGPFKEFFAAWVAAYTATNETYEMPQQSKATSATANRQQITTTFTASNA